MSSPASIIEALSHGITSPQEVAQRQAQAQQTQQQTRNLQTEDVGKQLSNQAAQQQLRDNEIIKNAFVNGGADPVSYAAQNGISGAGYLGLQNHLLGVKEQYAKLTKAEQENAVAAHTQNANILSGIYQVQDPAKRAQLLEQARPMLQANEAHLPDTGRHDWSTVTPDDDSLKFAINANGLGGQLVENSLKQAQAKEAQAKTAETQSNVAKNAAQLEGVKAESFAKQLGVAGQQAASINDQESWTRFRNSQPATIAAQIPAQFSPDSVKAVQTLGMTSEEQVRSAQAASQLAATIKRDSETARHNLSDEAIGKLTAGVAAGRLAQEQMVNGMKYGPGTTEYWVEQLKQNPDSIKELPPELRSKVGQGFTAATGLPLPTAASSQTQTQEAAARSALDGIDFVKNALKNPEIRKNLGPIMGRLADAEQSVGTSGTLSPEASALAQELRTRMRYLVFQEGKSILGGRLPKQLLDQLTASSPNPHMDAGLLEGALNGTAGSAQSILENADKQRFGGKARPPEMRGVQSSGSSTPIIQHSPSTGAYRFSTDGGKTWQAGQPK